MSRCGAAPWAVLLLALGRVPPAPAQEPEPASPPPQPSAPRPAAGDDARPRGAAAPPAEEGPPDASLRATVTGRREDRRPSATRLRAEEAAQAPGTQGDPLKAAQALPGVARAPVGSGQLVVWGAAPRETRVLLDGVELPALYHLGGLRSVIPATLVRRFELVPAAPGAAFGGGLGGVLLVDTQTLAAERKLHLAADVLDASASAAGEPAAGVRVAAAARVGWLDRILSAISAPEVGDLFPTPRYWDAQLVASAALREGEELRLFALFASDSLQRSLPAAGASAVRSQGDSSREARLSLRYRLSLADGGSVSATAWWGDDGASTRLQATGRTASLETRTGTLGLRASWQAQGPWDSSLQLGADGKVARTRALRQGPLALPPREGDVSAFGQPIGPEAAADDWTVTLGEAGLWAQAELRAGPLLLVPGLRLGSFTVEVPRVAPPLGLTPPLGDARLLWAVEPRLAAALRLGEQVRLLAAGGLHHQAPDPTDLSAVFGNPRLGIARSTQLSAGAEASLPAALVELTGWLRLLSGLAVRSSLAQPLLAQALTDQGTGRAFGLQVTAQLPELHGLDGSLAYGLSRSERRDGPGQPVRLFDFDQTHLFTALARLRLGAFTLGARLRLSSGYPRTPVTGAYFDARAGQYQPVFGALNATRLPAFAALDLRAERAFPLGGARQLRLSLEVLNATAHANAEEYAYDFDWRPRGVITGLPALAVLGAGVDL